MPLPDLSPLPKLIPPADGWDASLMVYRAGQMEAERQRCYALGLAAERERLVQVVRDFQHWLGPQAKRELLAAMGVEAIAKPERE